MPSEGPIASYLIEHEWLTTSERSMPCCGHTVTVSGVQRFDRGLQVSSFASDVVLLQQAPLHELHHYRWLHYDGLLEGLVMAYVTTCGGQGPTTAFALCE